MKFTQEGAKEFEKELLAKGYKKYIQHYKSEDFMYWKNFERKYDEDGDKTEGYSVGFAFYDFSKYPQFKEPENVSVSLEFMLGTNLGVDRLDVTVTEDNLTVEKFEKFSAELYKFLTKSIENGIFKRTDRGSQGIIS